MDVETELTFIVDTGQKPVAASVGPSGRIEHVGEFEKRRVVVRDARPIRHELALDVQGFRLVDHATAIRSFSDREAIGTVYYREAEALLRAETGARRVVVFDHTLRSGDVDEQERDRLREPVPVPHNDYTEWSGPNRLSLALPEEAASLATRRFAIVQLWRPTHDPVERDPLALCDARSVREESLLAAERRHAERIGEIYQLQYARDQRWHWFPRMTRDEAIVFKVFDSARDGRARFTPHTSFPLPDVPSSAPPRRSIEIRALALF